MILLNGKLVYIHIPKTSGSSFTKIIKEYAMTNKKTYDSGSGWQGSYHFNNGCCDGQPTSINDLNKKDLLKIANVPIITIVRNPYSWLVSVHESFYKGNIHTFKNFILQLKREFAKYFRKFIVFLRSVWVNFYLYLLICSYQSKASLL